MKATNGAVKGIVGPDGLAVHDGQRTVAGLAGGVDLLDTRLNVGHALTEVHVGCARSRGHQAEARRQDDDKRRGLLHHFMTLLVNPKPLWHEGYIISYLSISVNINLVRI
jgi:hypothetical protein